MGITLHGIELCGFKCIATKSESEHFLMFRQKKIETKCEKKMMMVALSSANFLTWMGNPTEN